MKKLTCCLILIAMLAALLAACIPFKSPTANTPTAKVQLRVITSYGGDDGNRSNYSELIRKFEDSSGYKIIDDSGTTNEEWKAKVNSDFQTGAEADVLLYFTGTDSEEFIKNNKVVSIEEIQKIYPLYASNMKSDMLPVSVIDAKHYAVPVNGYWEALYVNKTVLQACGITEIPDKTTSWDEFMDMCRTVKQKGFTPIAISLQEVPHYLFEYAVYNEGDAKTHQHIPTSSVDEAGKRWAQGFSTIKDMYEQGFFPHNTLTATDTETFQLLINDEAAFAIDGSWKMGLFTGVTNNDGTVTPGNATNLDNFEVTFVPSKGLRANSDIISGISMGYFITKKAWDNPQKRDAAVQFVSSMTTDLVINLLAQGAPTALKSGIPTLNVKSNLQTSTMNMLNNSTYSTPSVSDSLNKTARNWLFKSVNLVVTGKLDVYEAIDTALSIPLQK